MASLSCPSEYEAVIVDSLTQLPLAYLPWASIKWDRRRNQISLATVVVAGVSGGIECCSFEEGLRGWSQMLRIERNGGVVWDGPIVGWSVSSGDGTLTIRAQDRFVLTQKRLVGVYRFLNAQTPNAIIQRLVSDAAIGNPTYDPYTLTVVSAGAEDERLTREYRVERVERVFDCIDEICQNSTTGYFSTLAGSTYVYEPTARVACGNVLAGGCLRLSEETTVGKPGVDVDCLGQITRFYAAASGQGVSGYPQIVVNNDFSGVYLSSLLEKGSAESRVGATADLTLLAARGAAENATPATTLERIRVNENFGSPMMLANLANLIPGAQVRIDFDGTCAFNVPFVEYSEAAGVSSHRSASSIAYARIDMIEFSVTRDGNGISEDVDLSLRPTIPTVTP